jgi:uncharacterized protein (TIGR00255 family)
MLESMTGFGSSDFTLKGYRFNIEVKSVNNRFFDARIKLPSSLNKLEPEIRQILKESLIRGSVDCYIKVSKDIDSNKSSENNKSEDNTETITLDQKLLEQYIKAIEKVKSKFKVDEKLQISDLMRIPNLFITEDLISSSEDIQKAIMACIKQSIDSVIKMQKKEGKATFESIQSNIKNIENNIKKIKKSTINDVKETHKKLFDKIASLLENTEISHDRILTEAGIIAQRKDISEELDRLQSHLEQFSVVLNSAKEAGKKLDFITQEVNREINTISSKTENNEVTYLCVECKSLAEKIREQIQNVK